MTLLSANELGVFSVLGSGSLGAAEVANACATPTASMEKLLDACAGQELLIKENGRYRNSATAEAFLVRGKPSFLGDALRYSQDLYSVWGRLSESVRTNQPAIPPQSILGTDKEKTRNFVLGMHNRAMGVAASMAQSIDLSGRKQLLDVGGGPGTYSILLVKKTSGLHSTVLDLPAVVEIARSIVESHGCGDRIGFLPGDYRSTAFPPGNDAVLMSGMMHRETQQSCRSLIEKAVSSLVPGGVLIVSDVFFADETKTSPPFAGLFALTMMLTAENAGAHAQTEMATWMNEAGLGDVRMQTLPPPMPHVIIFGTK